MDTPMDVGAVILIKLCQPLNHLLRLLCCRRVVEIDDRLVLYSSLEIREITSDLCNVHCYLPYISFVTDKGLRLKV